MFYLVKLNYIRTNVYEKSDIIDIVSKQFDTIEECINKAKSMDISFDERMFDRSRESRWIESHGSQRWAIANFESINEKGHALLDLIKSCIREKELNKLLK